MQMLKARTYRCHKKKILISKLIYSPITLQLWEISKYFKCFFLVTENDLCLIPISKIALKKSFIWAVKNYFCPILKSNGYASVQRVYLTLDYKTLKIQPETLMQPSNKTRWRINPSLLFSYYVDLKIWYLIPEIFLVDWITLWSA